jgi:TM2 domain-containing membrane protein YozV
MRGKVLTYDDDNARGLISGDDGIRYAFTRGDLAGDVRSVGAGATVDFQVREGAAVEIYILARANPFAGDRNRVVAALLALFVGMFGAHKFYLGKTGPAVIMLLCGTIGWLLLCIPPFVVWVISFVEFIIYLVKSDAEFDRDYIKGDRGWF